MGISLSRIRILRVDYAAEVKCEREAWVRRRKVAIVRKMKVKHTQELEKQSSLGMSVRSLRTVRVCVGPDR